MTSPREESAWHSQAHRAKPENRFEVYLVGGGIASLSAAAFLIRDGDVPGHRITILEELGRLGGSLDASGSAESGYVLRGGRMFEEQYRCTFNLFASIPTLDDRCTVTQEIEQWNVTLKTSSKSRLFEEGARRVAPSFGLSKLHSLRLAALAIEPEFALGSSRISELFSQDFFETDFWIMWCTTFAFQPWHSAIEFKRYLARFVHMITGFNRLEGVMRTVYNQYDSMVRPLQRWLEQRGVRLRTNTCVDRIELHQAEGVTTATSLRLTTRQGGETIDLTNDDLVIVTLGSMTEGSALGSMTAPAVLGNLGEGSAVRLWKQLAWGRPEFGRPETFFSKVDQSKWISFTITMNAPLLLEKIVELTGNAPGEGGLITFKDSNWLMSLVVPHQPHVLGQPEDVSVFWGYGLYPDRIGNFVNESMSASSGEDIMTELLGHLGLSELLTTVLVHCICIPCMLPFITSQFLPREAGDRPEVVPRGCKNIAIVGQFCELPDDVVFTVEYSIRSAQTAVIKLLHLDQAPPEIYKGLHHAKVLYEAYRTMEGEPARRAS
jgi:oleate hydratase